MTETTPSCPACQSGDVVPIAYGLPMGEGLARAQRGEVMLGGCVVWDESPQWHCRACGAAFGDHQEEAAAWRSEQTRRKAQEEEET